MALVHNKLKYKEGISIIVKLIINKHRLLELARAPDLLRVHLHLKLQSTFQLVLLYPLNQYYERQRRMGNFETYFSLSIAKSDKAHCSPWRFPVDFMRITEAFNFTHSGGHTLESVFFFL